MAFQPEVVSYDTGVYQLEVIDPVDGGVGAVSNKPLLNLANRTAYLYQHVTNLENGTTIPPTVAPLNNANLTGTPTAPTPALGDSSTKISTTAFVQGTVNGLASINVAGGANVTLTSAQAGNGILVFTGALTANIAAIVPNSSKTMIVENLTSGAFTLTVKTAAGTGIAVTQGKTQELFCDGTNVLLSSSDFVNMALTGTPTAPTAAQFDSSAKLANTAFVLQSGIQASGITFVVASGTLSTSVAGGTVVGNSSAAITQTLPALSSFRVGARIEFINLNTGVMTIARAGADTIAPNLGSSLTSMALGNGDTLTLEAGPSYWYAVGGSAQLAYAAAFGSSLGASGYQKLPSGLMLQWGVSSAIAPLGSQAITLPLAFPHAALTGYATGGVGNSGIPEILSLSTTQITVGNPTTGSSNTPYYWFALGY